MLMVGRMRSHVMVRYMKVVVGVVVLVVMGYMVGMQRGMVVKPEKIRRFPNQPCWLAVIRTSLLFSLLVDTILISGKVKVILFSEESESD